MRRWRLWCGMQQATTRVEWSVCQFFARSNDPLRTFAEEQDTRWKPTLLSQSRQFEER